MKKFYKYAKIILLSSVAFLTACVQIPQNEIGELSSVNDKSFQERMIAVNKIGAYELKASLGVVSQNPSARFTMSMSFENRKPLNYQMKLSNSYVGKYYTIKRFKKGLIVQEGGQSITINDIPAFLRENFGASYPIDHFSDWLKGYPSGNIFAIKVDLKHQLRQFKFTNEDNEVWTIDYVTYDQQQMPKLMVISNGNQFLRIKINNWSIQ